MVLLNLLPIGLLQTWAAVEHGTWYARSAEFLQTGIMDTLRWLRLIGDTIFAVGALALGWFVLGLVTGHGFDTRGTVAPPARPKCTRPCREPLRGVLAQGRRMVLRGQGRRFDAKASRTETDP
jgi:hypothetical protein